MPSENAVTYDDLKKRGVANTEFFRLLEAHTEAWKRDGGGKDVQNKHLTAYRNKWNAWVENNKDETLDFSGFTFSSGDNYLKLLVDTNFKGDPRFNFEAFNFCTVNFMNATFEGGTNFSDATFEGMTNFSFAMFSGEANLMNATFKGESDFRNATFSGEAHFWKATFEGESDFWDVTFSGEANFNDVKFLYTFSFNCSTNTIPDFSSTLFKNTPNIQDHEDWIKPVKLNSQNESAYRYFKTYFKNKDDHEKELEYFKLEMKCKKEKAKGIHGVLLYLYEKISKYGTSYKAPLTWYIVLTLIFYAIGNLNHIIKNLSNSMSGFPWIYTLWDQCRHLTPRLIKNMIPFLPIDVDNGIDRWYEISVSLLSIPLVFLFILGIKNRFKLK